MEVVGVYSLEDAEDLIRRRGEEDEVEVRVHGCMLRDVPELRRILREQIRERHWGVVNLSNLRQFVPVDQDIGTAAEMLTGLIWEPDNNIVAAAQARAQDMEGLAASLMEAKMTWAKGLGRLLETLAGVMRRGNRSPGDLRRMVQSARVRCREVSGRYVSTVPVQRGANLVQNYMEHL